MKSLILIALTGFIGFYFSDVRSGGIIGSFIAPLVLFGAIVAFMLWLKRRSLKRRTSADDGDGPIHISSSDFE